MLISGFVLFCFDFDFLSGFSESVLTERCLSHPADVFSGIACWCYRLVYRDEAGEVPLEEGLRCSLGMESNRKGRS